MDTQQEKKTRFTALVATGVIGAFLLGSTTFFYVDNKNLQEENKVIAEQVESLTTVKQKLELDIQMLDQEIAKHKGKNKELDQMLVAAKADLEKRKQKISKLTKQNASLSKYKKEAKELRKAKTGFLSRLDELNKKYNLLSEENNMLRNDNAKLKSELEELNANYMLLERKVEIASILKVDKVFATSEKKTKNGKYTKVSGHKKADRFLVSFDLSENRVSEPGDKNIYIRIIDPAGNVLPAPSSERGYFTNNDGNIELPYSAMKTVNYSNKGIKDLAIYEIGKQELKEGNYTIEFYCDGYFCGASGYKLK
jgi:myosin heavy subunit